MSPELLRCFPPPCVETPLHGLYLNLDLHRLGTAADPFVYANFLSSLDGRIALEDDNGEAYMPKNFTTRNDFRLFLELQCQADCLITHGGYLRALAAGRLGNILQIGAHPAGADLVGWRLAAGLPAQPDVVIASASLDFPMPESLWCSGQRCYIATGEKSDPQRVRRWRDQGYDVIFVGQRALVEGRALVRELSALGYRTLYLVAGPQMLDTMLQGGCLARLFHTVSHQLLGGGAFHTLLAGPLLGAAGNLRLLSLYYDPGSPAQVGQWFGQFEPVPRGPESNVGLS